MFFLFFPFTFYFGVHKYSTQLSLPDAPVAVGRSGVRIEQGVSTSGLLGERLMLGEDPQRNSFAQRVWLYANDPALNYK
jgi:hypothetical protein